MACVVCASSAAPLRLRLRLARESWKGARRVVIMVAMVVVMTVMMMVVMMTTRMMVMVMVILAPPSSLVGWSRLLLVVCGA